MVPSRAAKLSNEEPVQRGACWLHRNNEERKKEFYDWKLDAGKNKGSIYYVKKFNVCVPDKKKLVKKQQIFVDDFQSLVACELICNDLDQN